ncbi:MAG: methyl-accepting chemotaxis protein [Sphingomonas adhaesiva]|uniref:methyl-accepting chemotaxis protein n=1 Tax=Sphingomonas adhaesiva TaxID=28212 RepID=UPI002FF46E5F
MLTWFKEVAPIRLKFKVLLLVYGALSGSLAALACTASYAPGSLHPAAVAGVAATLVGAVVAVTMLAAHLICTPYVDTVLRMEALAAGDINSPVAYTQHRDCVGRMTTAMESFRESSLAAAECHTQRAMALAMGEGLNAIANGDLAYRISAELSGPFAKLKDDFNAAAAALSTALATVNDGAAGIAQGAGDIHGAADDLSRRTEQQAASLEQAAAAMQQITTTVQETAGNAIRANDVVSEARRDAEQSGDVVHRAVQAMTGIERASAEISEIIAVIDGIAFQTNLLALNAGVEAARAGEAGRGFAVVASEVRALAQRSAEAAKDVKVKITSSSQQVDAGVKLVAEAGASLDRISGRIADISVLVAGIASAADQQATGLQQVNVAVAEMDSVTQQNAAMVEETMAAVASLTQQTDRMSVETGRFRVGGETVAPMTTMAPRRVAPSTMVQTLRVAARGA